MARVDRVELLGVPHRLSQHNTPVQLHGQHLPDPDGRGRLLLIHVLKAGRRAGRSPAAKLQHCYSLTRDQHDPSCVVQQCGVCALLAHILDITY